jgi:predicted transcriptional regulator
MNQDMNIQFSELDLEITEILTNVGLKSNEARVLVVLFKGYDLTSREIERLVDLRQPEVSIAINLLISRKWAHISSLITEKKGRPVKVYSLSISIDAILDQIEEQIEGDYRGQLETIERVRSMVKESRVSE